MSSNNLITIVEAEQNGVSMDMVRVCKEIRRLAQLDRISLDESTHRSGLNRHLYAYVEYCGMNVKEYIKDYLSNLHPYMIERYKGQEPESNFICVLDNIYRVSIYIKLDKTFGNEVIVSFHENNKRGIAKENNLIQNKQPQLVPVFADEVCATIEGSPKEEIKVFVQRGMLTLPLRIMGQKCENGVYIVNRDDIEVPILEQCNQYLRDMYTSDLDLEALDQVEIFSFLHQISFTSYGNTIFSNISLLIDNMAIQKGQISKKVADFALITYIEHLSIDKQHADELIELLEDKYSVRSQKGIDLILERIKNGLDAKNQEPEIELVNKKVENKSITVLPTTKRPKL